MTNIAQADLDFSGRSWSVSDSSVSLVDNQLKIGTGGGVNGWAETILSIPLSSQYKTVIEQRIKLESGGRNYRLPGVSISFEDSYMLWTTYLSNENSPVPVNYGWLFGDWTGNYDHGIPGTGWWDSATADYWAITKMEITPTGGKLFVKPSDPLRNWTEWPDDTSEFKLVGTMDWSHTSIEKMRIQQPWDSVNYVDYVAITSQPVPIPAAIWLFGAGLVGLVGVRRKIKK